MPWSQLATSQEIQVTEAPSEMLSWIRTPTWTLFFLTSSTRWKMAWIFTSSFCAGSVCCTVSGSFFLSCPLWIVCHSEHLSTRFCLRKHERLKRSWSRCLQKTYIAAKYVTIARIRLGSQRFTKQSGQYLTLYLYVVMVLLYFAMLWVLWFLLCTEYNSSIFFF